VTIIEHHYRDETPSTIDPAEAKRSMGLNPDWPVVLFAGEISHATGADLLMDALINVCRDHGQVQFAFVGDGPLRNEIEGRAWNAGLGHRCRFLGDVPSNQFDDLMIGCDSVCIPARTWQDEGLAQKALAFGKPVLTTHQSQIHCVQHGQNGLVTYDNPGSIIWGLKELLANPLRGSMIHLLSRQQTDQSTSLENVAAEHYLAYERALAEARGASS
jgi:glycosyltransferase involved in cell wall biosynthesis